MNQFRLPYHLIVDEGIFGRIPAVMEDAIPDIDKKKTIIVTEENLKGIFGSIIEGIEKSFPESEMYLIQSASYDNAVALAKYITMNDIKVVIGFGGGTVLDLAKFAAFVSKARLISLPTTLSNDSLASPVAVLGTEGKARKTFKCTIPHAILVDASVIMSAPERQLLAGIGDTVSKYTALNDWKIAHVAGQDHVDDFAYMISKMAFNSIAYNDMKELKSVDFIKRLTQALVMGGLAMEIAGTSRPSSGSEHLFCHALEENYADKVNVPHGIAVAMGSYGACKFQKRNIAKITRIIKEYNLPVVPSDWKITEDIFVGAWQGAAASRPDRYTILNEIELSDEMLRKLYYEMEDVFAN
ncbi:MAG: iron-containing alcohol dehydrogenase family protein [Eubacterium sp.]|nr:iron-containing alcohol dehydrogenase family protein [Eubacterium sp.]